jgi:hypothetical protein
MPYCLLRPLAEKFRKGLKDGTINPAKLADMSSDERATFFEGIIGKEDSKKVNSLFESKLLLKDVEQGMITWAKTVTGIKPQVRRTLIEKIQRLDERILSPEGEKKFLASLAETKLGTEVTLEEATKITQLSKDIQEKRKEVDPTNEDWKTDPKRFEYGMAVVELEDYINDRKSAYHDMGVVETIKTKGEEIKQRYKDQGVIKGTAQTIGRAIKKVSDTSIASVASFDNSFMGRQGLNVLLTHPSAWIGGAKKSWSDIGKTLIGKDASKTLRADIYSRPNAINGLYKQAGILNMEEEYFPTSLPAKIPVLGRGFKASEVVFTGSGMRMRADLFDILAKNVNLDSRDSEQVKSTGIVVNSLLARGDLGKNGQGLKAILWAPKMLKANYDILTAHTGDYLSGKITKEAWKEALMNWAKIMSTTALVALIAQAMGGEVEKDPRSADFGKIKKGDTRIDITGGKGSLITLASRLITGKTKSTTTGAVTELGSGFGQQSKFDAIISFLTNKVNPPIRVIVDILKGETFDGQEVTLSNELYKSFAPIIAQNIIEASKTGSQEQAIGVLTDFVGFSANTYSDKSAIGTILDKETTKQIRDIENSIGKKVQITNWDTSTSAELKAFKDKFGESDEVGYGNAKKRFAEHIKTMVNDLITSDKYKNMSSEDKISALNKIDTEAKNKVFKQFNWKYKK